MADKSPKLSFRFVSYAQPRSNRAGDVSYQGRVEQIRAAFARFGGIVVEDFALRYVSGRFDEAKKTISRDIHRIVKNEVDRMANAIARGLHRPDGSTGPWGTLRISGDVQQQRNSGRGEVMSNQAAELGWTPTWDRSDAGIKWASRDKQYMRRKRREGKAPYWFKATGELQNWLRARSSADYLRSFGQLSVRFEKLKDAKPRTNAAPSGIRGGQGTYVMVGKLSVNYFNKITPDILPGLKELELNSKPKGGPGAASLLPDGVDKYKLTTKSHGPNRQHRHSIDPFVSFYMTRAIPNAIWRRTERLTRG